MKNTKSLSCVRARHTMEAKKKSKRGEGYVDSGVKILIAVVIGALLLAGLYFLMNNVILPKADEKVTSMFDTSNEVAGTYEIGADVGGGGTGGGGSMPSAAEQAAIGEVVTMGTFLKDGLVLPPASVPYPVGAEESEYLPGNLPDFDTSSTYTFGDTDKLNAAVNLKWIKVSDTLFVCDRNLLCAISWDDINGMGYVDGSKTVEIDGCTYRIRLLTESEWMATIGATENAETYGKNDVSHWTVCYSWTSTSAGSDYYYYCGYSSASYSCNYFATYRDYYAGFRPALELAS